jgi:hypothetical protein
MNRHKIGQDTKYDPDQGKPYLPFINELLSSASGKDQDGNLLLTAADVSRYLGQRRSESRANNPDFTLTHFHKMFGSSKYVLYSLQDHISDIILARRLS